MTPEQFQHLLKRYRQGSCSPEERKFIEKWYASIGSRSEPSVDPQEEDALKNRYWKNVNAHIQSQKPDRRRIITLWPAVGIAASIAMAITAGVLLLSSPKSQVSSDHLTIISPESHKFENSTAVPKDISLPDGSNIILQPGGKIRYYTASDRSNREVFLEGEAFFNVKRDVLRPFLVHSQEVTTKVLGTSFTVKAERDAKSITVSVKTGKVSVYTNRGDSGPSAKSAETILTPNQQIVYNRHEHKVARMLVENPQAIVSAEEIKKWHFEDAPVMEIFHALEKVYGVNIEFDAKTLSGCTLTTSISDEPIYNRLDIICKAIGTTYTVEETKIVVRGSGCN